MPAAATDPIGVAGPVDPLRGGAIPLDADDRLVPDQDTRRGRRTRWDRSFPLDPAAPSSVETLDDPAEDIEDLVEAEPKAASKWRKPLWAIGIAAALVLVTIALWGKLPSPGEIWAAVQAADWWWVLAAAVAMLISIVSFAFQQRELLLAFDTPIGWRRIIVITFGGTAMTNSLPAGAAVSAGYSFRQYRLAHASRSTAATVMVLSGLLSIGSLALMYVVVLWSATANSLVNLLMNNPVVSILLALIVAAAIALLIRRVIRGSQQPDDEADTLEAPTPRLDRWEQKHPKWVSVLRDGLDTLRRVKLLRTRFLVTGIGYSVLKWVAEAVCLLTCCLAFEIHIDLLPLAVIYLSVQLVRQVPFTPGGIGLVEASLLTGLVSAGAASGPAAAAILIYRFLSAWLIIPVGFAMLAEMKRRDANREALATVETNA